MGFDLWGIAPRSPKGHYLRGSFLSVSMGSMHISMGGWRSFWKFIYQLCKDIITESEYKYGLGNNHIEITEKKALIIADRCYNIILDSSSQNRGVDTSMLWRFATFCKDSGGFEIA